jgi:hypothetical protein
MSSHDPHATSTNNWFLHFGKNQWLDSGTKLSKSNIATILELIDDFPEQLAWFTGLGGRPLAYVIHELEPVLP